MSSDGADGAGQRESRRGGGPERNDDGNGDEPVPAVERTWIEAVDDVLDSAVDRDEVLEATFEEFTVDVPMRTGSDADHARWRLDGTVRVSVDGASGPLADWLRWWYERTRAPAPDPE